MGMSNILNGRERKLITLRSLAAKRKVRSSWVYLFILIVSHKTNVNVFRGEEMCHVRFRF